MMGRGWRTVGLLISDTVGCGVSSKETSSGAAREVGRPSGGRVLRRLCLLCACGLVLAPMPVEALELSGGVSLGGILAGTQPHLAVSPHAGLSFRLGSGFLFAVHDVLSLLPATNKDGLGVRNETSAALGAAWEKGNFSVGPALSFYSMPTCRNTLCGRVVGLSPGVHAQASAYFAGPLGVSVSATVDWLVGSSLILPGGVAATVVAGPVVRWQR